MPEPHLRAADTDRTAVATVLGRHMADGRLTVAEYDERVARAYAARTYGDLDELTADLPAMRPRSLASSRSPRALRARARLRPRGGRGRDPASAWAAWRRTAIIVLTHLGDQLGRRCAVHLLLADLGRGPWVALHSGSDEPDGFAGRRRRSPPSPSRSPTRPSRPPSTEFAGAHR